MLRKLVLMRHAKSSWKSDAENDHSRPLNKRGNKDAPLIASRLAELGWIPELVLSSDAVRTRETWARMENLLSPPPRVAFTRSLYLAGIGEVKSELALVPSDVGTLLLLGHNDGWEDILTFLTGDDRRLPTAAAALLSAEGESWIHAWNTAPSWKIHRILRPKELRE